MRKPEIAISADRPIGSAPEDRLGFAEMASHLAKAFLNNDLSQGFVIGVEGSWGSGKSSLVNLALSDLRAEPDGVAVVEFQPWLVGQRDDLLRELFELLVASIAGLTNGKKDQLTDDLRLFSRLSRTTGKVLGGLGAAGVPGAQLLEKLSEGAANLSDAASTPEALSTIKRRLQSALANLSRPIIIFIDDLDRLDPAEAVEVLRLIRAVADFPNVAYLLAYDADVLAHNLETALGIKNGRAYLEKIVQASFSIPLAQSFDLRNWFADEVARILGEKSANYGSEQRLSSALLQWPGEFFKTPRDVVRTLNAVRLYGSPVLDKVDSADIIFLQIVRVHAPKLFDWIQEYVFNLSAIGDWGHLIPSAPERVGQKLLAILSELEDQDSFLFSLREHLPGIPTVATPYNNEKFKVFEHVSRDDLAAFTKDRRLASPQHFRLYFSFTEPTGMLNDARVLSFVDLATRNLTQAIQEFHGMTRTPRPQGGTMAELLISRLRRLGPELPVQQIPYLFYALAPGMDQAIADTGFPFNFNLRGDRNSLFRLITRLDPKARAAFLPDFFRTCPSLVWIIAIFRSSTFDHGIAGDKERPEEARLFTRAEHDQLWSILRERLRAATPETLLATPSLLSTLYAWAQGGAPEEARAWVKQQTQTDDGLIGMLERMQGHPTSSAGNYVKLSSSDLAVFFDDVESVKGRLQKASADHSAQGDRARRLMQSIKAGDEF